MVPLRGNHLVCCSNSRCNPMIPLRSNHLVWCSNLWWNLMVPLGGNHIDWCINSWCNLMVPLRSNHLVCVLTRDVISWYLYVVIIPFGVFTRDVISYYLYAIIISFGILLTRDIISWYSYLVIISFSVGWERNSKILKIFNYFDWNQPITPKRILTTASCQTMRTLLAALIFKVTATISWNDYSKH